VRYPGKYPSSNSATKRLLTIIDWVGRPEISGDLEKGAPPANAGGDMNDEVPF